MKAALTIIAFSFYALIGVCPMQVSAMSMEHDMDMMVADMDVHPLLEGDVAVTQDKGVCPDCLSAATDYALKKVQLTDNGTFASLIYHYSIAQYFEVTDLPRSHVPPKWYGGVGFFDVSQIVGSVVMLT